MKFGQTFAISLCLNLALGSTAIRFWQKPVATKPPATAQAIARIEFATASAAASNLPAPAAATYVTNRFNWKQAESDDWEKLSVNLRAIGCPEKTVRDLVFARARRALDRIARERGPQLPYWTAGVRWQRTAEEGEWSREIARAKIRATLQRAVSVDSDPREVRGMDHFEEEALTRFIIGPMPEEKFQQLTALMGRFQESNDVVYARCQGVQLEEDLVELRQLQTQFAREAAALVGRDRFEEFTARSAMISDGGEVKWEATDLSPMEVRQLALIRARFQGPTTEIFHDCHPTTDEEDEQIRAAIHAFLGERRAAEFERAADGGFQRLFELGKDLHLPREAAAKAHDIRKLAVREAGQLREDKSLSDAQRQQRLEQMQAETQAAMLQTLGATACQQYLQRGGEWVTNFTKL